MISDIDDTVLVSEVTHLLAKLMLLKDATERSPFSGIAAFLRALRTGRDGRASNPIFYVHADCLAPGLVADEQVAGELCLLHPDQSPGIRPGRSAGIIDCFLTISFQTVKAALVNPVKSLRAE